MRAGDCKTETLGPVAGNEKTGAMHRIVFTLLAGTLMVTAFVSFAVSDWPKPDYRFLVLFLSGQQKRT